MTENVLVRLFEHNNWANIQIIRACSALSDEQLDAEPKSATKGSIRRTLLHLVHSQQHYLSLLTLPVEARHDVAPAFAELERSARISGDVLLALAKDESNQFAKRRLQTQDGYWVEPWLVMVQVINHATEHREQINSMLSSLGVTPPDLDGWTYGEVTHTLIPVSAV